MKILGIECSAGPVSAAVSENGVILSESFANIRLTHSQTLLPMVMQSLENSRLSLEDIDYIAVAAGPGSFTGIRIGISAAKGLAAPLDIPCVPVSSLLGMTAPFMSGSSIICAVMDARCNQVYNAVFKIKHGSVTRLCDDRALLCEELAKEMSALSSESSLPIFITGDGTDLFMPYLNGISNAFAAPAAAKFQSASGICLAAEKLLEDGSSISADKLLPVYLRLPQAERELKKKEAERKPL